MCFEGFVSYIFGEVLNISVVKNEMKWLFKSPDECYNLVDYTSDSG